MQRTTHHGVHNLNGYTYNITPTPKAQIKHKRANRKLVRARGLGCLLRDCVFHIGQKACIYEISAIW